MCQHTRVTIEKYWVLFCALCAYNSERLPASVEYFVCSTARGWRWCEDSTVASDLPLVSSKFSRDGNTGDREYHLFLTMRDCNTAAKNLITTTDAGNRIQYFREDGPANDDLVGLPLRFLEGTGSDSQHQWYS